jgi:thiosulfate/3-mercaptopyruvate sulfurtransferase
MHEMMMKKNAGWLKAVLVLMMVMLPLAAAARDIDPIVSADWLQTNLSNAKLVIVDVRKVEEYKTGHIPGAVNVFYNSWAVKKGELLNELPPLDDLMDTIGAAGINPGSWVVLVGKTEKVPDQFDMTRVAWTLKYACVENVAILNGGLDQWVREKRPLSQDVTKAKAKTYKAEVRRNLIIDKKYLLSKLGQATVLDTRGPNFFAGKEKLPFVAKMGRIKGAVNLPVAQLFTKEGLYKDKAEIASLATKAAGNDPNKEIILYCDTGKTCTSWAFIMADLLGYKDVKIYDGSFMEWAADPTAPIE